MDEIYINLKELYGFKYIRDYFYKKDLVSVEDIVDAFEYELERQEEKEEYTKDDYEYDMYEGRRAEEYGENS